MQWKMIKNRFLALIMSLMILASGLPANAFCDTIIADSPESWADEPAGSAELVTGLEDETSHHVPDNHETTEPYPENEAQTDDSGGSDNHSDSVEDAIRSNGHAYVMTIGNTCVYETIERAGLLFTITQENAVLLATQYVTQEDRSSIAIWFLTQTGDIISGYIDRTALVETVLRDDEVRALIESVPGAPVASDAGELHTFVVTGEYHNAAYVELATEDSSSQVDEWVEEPASEDEGTPEDSMGDEEQTSEQPVTEQGVEQTLNDDETPVPNIALTQVGDFVSVTTQTRAFQCVDDSATDDYAGDSSLGVFVRDAAVQVASITQDSFGRYWYEVFYQYGDDFADGTMKWTEHGIAYVLAAETGETHEGFSVTDFAFASMPMVRLRGAGPMDGFSLKSINAPVPSLYAGQSGVHGSSGRDSDYAQIATLPGHGTIYATPHYLDGFTVYCLEHNLPGPGENISGGSQQPTGPYVIVDVDSYMNTPGYSSIIYRESTLHAIAWVLRHTYPFMVLDRSDADNETWSRVAGQFAIREVIKQMEGAQYVRPYWDMANFYSASGQAPEVYLQYARWLAANGIARGNITGDIYLSNKSMDYASGMYTGTATLTTDADLIRISKSAGTVTGNTAGADGSYYYLNSGDTISVTTASNNFTVIAESVSSEDEEASFLVGVPSASIQKVLIPQYGIPYKLKSVSILFEIPHGSIVVTKKGADTGGVLMGATFELLDRASVVIQTQTTGADGVATFSDVQPGSYVVREKSAPEGYIVSVLDTQTVTVDAGNVSNVTFTNEVITSKIRIIKKDQLTSEPLAGAEFTVTRISAPASHNGAGIGNVVAVITTDANGIAGTDWLSWGAYRAQETKVPEHYVDNHFSVVIEAYENGKTYEIEVENEPAKGWIQLTKTDRQNGNPIEGVQFDIYYNDQYGDGLAGTMVTGTNGIAISGPLRKGKYIVREHGGIAGYVFEEILLDCTIRPDEITELEATNQPVMVKLMLRKRDAEEPAESLPPATRGDGVLVGAEFRVLAGETVTDRQGNVIYAKGDIVVASLKTEGEDASVVTGELWPGLYEIVELAPPIGYGPSDEPIFVDTRSAALQSEEAIITYEGVKTNTIRYGALAIVKFLGDNKVHSEAGVIESPEAGAEFEVYLKSAGSYENARDIERDYLITDQYGRAKTKALPYGVYVLRQTVGKEGHAIMRSIDFMIDGTEDLNAPPILILNNEAIHYRLRIIKMDEETGNVVPLANTAFKVKDADGNYVKQSMSYPTPVELDTFLTNEDGEVTLPETIIWGQYFIEEDKSPDGYLISTEDIQVFVGHAGDTPREVYEVVVEVSNRPVKGHIVLEKKGQQLTGFKTLADAYGNTYQKPQYEDGYLARVVFELRAAEDIVGKDGTVWYQQDELIETLTTTGADAVVSKELPLGRYYLFEIEAPEGYGTENTRYEANLVFADNKTAMVETNVNVRNEYLPVEITLKKEREATQRVQSNDGTLKQVISIAPGEGFVFGLYADKDILYSGGTLMADTLVATGATDADGNLTFSGHYPHGHYYIKELSAPAGWKLNPNRFAISLTSAAAVDHVIRVSLPDAVLNELIYSPITLTKTDITGEETIPGALIEVRNSDNEVIYRAYTNGNGKIPDIPIMPGRYTFREVLAPEGYALNTDEFTFEVDAEGNVTGDTTIRDDYTRITLKKQDEGGKPLAGVVFGLLDENGTQLFTAVSDETGLVTFEKIPYGDFVIVETQPLLGYVKNGTKVEVSVDGFFVNPSEPIATIVNQPMIDHYYAFMKTDHEDNPLSGVKFSLEDAGGTVLRELVSEDDGVVHVNGLASGTYTIRETEALEGFTVSEEAIRVVIDEHYATPVEMVRLKNYPNIQTGVEMGMTPMMWAGVALVIAGAGLIAAQVMKGRGHKRHKKRR